MKRFWKLAVVLLVISLSIVAFVFSASATEEGTASSYTVTYGDTTVTGVGYPNMRSAVSKASESSSTEIYIKLNGNMLDVSSALGFQSGKTYYLDVNGYFYAGTGAISNYLFSTSENCTIYVYSSREGGAVFHSYSDNGTSANGHLMFPLNKNNLTINLGEATVNGVTYDGDNISFYGSGIADNNTGASTTTNTVMNIKGGSYYRTASGAQALFIIRGNATINIDSAFLYSPNQIFTFYNAYTSSKDSDGNLLPFPANGKIIVNNSTVYGANASGFIDEMSDDATLSFSDCYIVGSATKKTNGAGEVGRKEGRPTFERCIFSASALFQTENQVVNVYEYKEIKYDINKFKFYLASSATQADGTVKNTYRVDTESFKLQTVSTYVLFNQAVADEGEYSTVTWKVKGKEPIVEKWFNGQTPVAPSSILPEDTDIYRYCFADVEKVNGDVNYTARAYANFVVKANITLYTDFVYNAYIPVSVREYINAVTVAGNKIDLSKAETYSIMGEEYYVVTCPIPASKGASDYELIINVDGYNEAFDQKYILSIPEYSKHIVNGGYSDNSKNLIKKVVAYIISACELTGNDTSAFDGIEGIVDASAPTDAVKGTTPPTDFLNLFSSAQLSMGSSVNFRFNVKEGVTNGTAEFSFPVDGVYKTVTVTEEDWIEGGETGYYYEVTMRARDLGKAITVKVNGTSYKYSLSNYVFYANNTLTSDEYYTQRRLVNNLWAYHKASVGYTSATPEIDITVNNNSVTEYDIIAVNEYEISIANAIADAIYQKTGKRPEIVNATREGRNYVYVTVRTGLDTRSGESDFTVYEDNSNLYVVCQYASFANDGATLFVKSYISSLNASYNFDTNFKTGYNTDKVYYSDFGAKGDTVLTQNADGLYEAKGTDDFVYIKYAHTVANRFLRHTVYATPGKMYYICDTAPDGKNVERIDIKTNTVWTDAEFVIDDTNLYSTDAIKRYDYDIFRIRPTHAKYSIVNTASLDALAGIGPDTKKIDLDLGYDALLTIVNADKRVYVRYGSNKDDGKEQSELVVVDNDGNIEYGTELMLDYEKVTRVDVYRIDKTLLTLTGGKVISLAMRRDVRYTEVRTDEEGKQSTVTVLNDPYFRRGLSVARSNTTVKGLEHKIYNEFTVDEEKNQGLDGAPYSGFFGAGTATNVTFEDCIMCARRRYTKGTYGFSANHVNNIVLKDCTQSNFYKPGTTTISTVGDEYWGIGGTNFCKNMIYDGCMLTRFDAHAGLYRGKILNSTINMINLIGGGDMLIKDSVIMDDELITLRSDYGATWKGTITVSNTVLDTSNSNPRIFTMTWANHDFGYTCYFPNLVLDNFRLRTGNKATVKLAHSAWDYSKNTSVTNGDANDYEYGSYLNPIHLDTLPLHQKPDGTYEENVPNKNPCVPPEFVKIMNNDYNVKFNFMQIYEFFANVKIYDFSDVEIDSPLIPVETD